MFDPIFLIPFLPVILLVVIARHWFHHDRIDPLYRVGPMDRSSPRLGKGGGRR